MAGDSHNNGAGHSGGFLEGAECAAGGMGGDVFLYACGGGYLSQVGKGGRRAEWGGHLEPVPFQHFDGEWRKGDLQGIVGFLLGELEVEAFGDGDEPECAVAPV